MAHKCKRNPHRGVEQLVARRAHNPKVAGSSPAPATKKTQESAYAGSFVFAVIYENSKSIILRSYTPLSNLAVTLGYLRGLEIPSLRLEDMPRL